MRRQTKRPTRRKPDRSPNEHKYSTVGRYDAPWWCILYALAVVAAIFGIPAIMSWTYLQGWW